MRTTIDLEELGRYAQCPERERRHKLEGDTKTPQIELRYRSSLRKLMVRFYSEMLDGRIMTASELRRSWSTQWDISPALITRPISKISASTVNSTLSDEERMILRGATAIHKLCVRPMNGKISPVIVDEPFSITADGITITGRYDFVFEDANHQYWIVDWSEQTYKYAGKWDVRHAIMLESFFQQSRRPAGVLVDYLLTLGDYIEPAVRTPLEQKRQVNEAFAIARSLSLDINYRRIGDDCKLCPFKPSCLGVKVVQQKRPRGRPRNNTIPTSDP